MANGTTTTMNLSVVNPDTSGAKDDEIFICILGTDPSTNYFGYLNLTVNPPVMVSGPTFTYVPGTTSQTLAQINANQGSAISVPPIESARIYFAIRSDFEPALMVSSGPTPSKTNPTLFDKVELDTSTPGGCNINPTSVDFYGISYTIEATPSGANAPVTVGFNQSRQTIVDALQNIPSSPATRHSGNLSIFPDCFVTAQSTIEYTEKVLRVLAPKTMALTDWGPVTDVTLATQASHFFDAYVNNLCFKKNRQLTFYTKNYNPNQNNSPNQIWAQVNADGSAMSLYTNEAMTELYSIQPASSPPSNTVTPPSTPWPNPNFGTTPSSFHNVTGSSATAIDWGFVLFGNAGDAYPGNLTAPWIVDPAVMALMVSIDRGVAHLDDGITAWVDPSNYYLGDGTGRSTESMPIFYYSSILHNLALNGLAYVLSFDDIYGQNASIYLPTVPT
jgi:hypothetical protein